MSFRFISNVYFHIFTNICRENGRKCITSTYVAMQPDAYAPCYGNAHRRVTGPLWLKIGKLATSELCEYFVFNGIFRIRAFTYELSATLFRIPILSCVFPGKPTKFPPLTSPIDKRMRTNPLCNGINNNCEADNCLHKLSQ